MGIMKRWTQLLLYLLLNILVSTVTVLIVLFLWENTDLKTALTLSPRENQSEVVLEAEATPLPETAGALIEITNITGPGNLATERLRITRVGGDPGEVISLLNWRIRDEDNHEFNISARSGLNSLDLHNGGAIDIYTKSGASTPIELYLGYDEPLWTQGEIATLLDGDGNIQDTFVIP
jgi:hypothetical protein